MLNKSLEVEGTSTVANAKLIVAEMDKTLNHDLEMIELERGMRS